MSIQGMKSVGRTHARARGPSVARRIAKWVAILAVLCFAAAAVFLVLLFHVSPPPPVQSDPSAAQRLAEEMRQAEAEAASGIPQILRADQTEVNSLLDAYLGPQRNSAPDSTRAVLRDFRIVLSQGKIRAYILIVIRGRNVSIDMDGKLRTVDGYLEFEPLRGTVGSLPIPLSQLRRAVQKMESNREMREKCRLPANLKDVHVEDGKIMVTYK